MREEKGPPAGPPRLVEVVEYGLPATSNVERDIARFYDACYEEMYRCAGRFVDHGQAHEVVGVAAAEFFSGWAHRMPGENTAGNFKLVVARRAIDAGRRSGWKRRKEVDIDAGPGIVERLPQLTARCDMKVAEDRAEYAFVRSHTVDRLPEMPRKCWLLNKEAGMTTGEIAEALRISPITVRRHLTRANEMLLELARELEAECAAREARGLAALVHPFAAPRTLPAGSAPAPYMYPTEVSDD